MIITHNSSFDWVGSIKQENTNGYGIIIEGDIASTHPLLKISDDGTESLLRVQGNGNVGIGVDIASTALDVDGIITGTGLDIDGNIDISEVYQN